MDRTLIVSISGIRGIVGRGFDPGVIVRYTSAFGSQRRGAGDTIVVGRDARVSGEVCASLVTATLRSQGFNVLDIGLATTPTVEMAIIREGAAGGIVLSASHNPQQWNALKLLNSEGEFLSPTEAQRVIDIAGSSEERVFSTFDMIGGVERQDFLDYHIERILNLPFLDTNAIRARDFRIVVDGINSVGGIAIPALLRALGIRPANIICVNCEPSGRFAHPAEPLPANLVETCSAVAEHEADLAIVVDPDADRLALIADGGTYVSEELTQVLAADFLWQTRAGDFATNLSSSRAIDDVAHRYGARVHRAAVGEINVVEKMKETNSMLGGEGNGGVILPDLHYGRDALIGSAMILQHLANRELTLSHLVREMPEYHMVKLKSDISGLDPDVLLERMSAKYAGERLTTIDGVKIDFEDGWVHMRKSNTEPIIRVYAEAGTAAAAAALGDRFKNELLKG
jgi:phosphomannomutase